MNREDHSLIRATLVPMIVRELQERYGIGESAALEKFYKSPIAEAFADDETGLYGQSALAISAMVCGDYEYQ